MLDPGSSTEYRTHNLVFSTVLTFNLHFQKYKAITLFLIECNSMHFMNVYSLELQKATFLSRIGKQYLEYQNLYIVL